MVPLTETENTGGGVHCICLVDEEKPTVLRTAIFKMPIMDPSVSGIELNILAGVQRKGWDQTGFKIFSDHHARD